MEFVHRERALKKLNVTQGVSNFKKVQNVQSVQCRVLTQINTTTTDEKTHYLGKSLEAIVSLKKKQHFVKLLFGDTLL